MFLIVAIKNYLSGHICIFLTCFTVTLKNYLYYSFINLPEMKVTDEKRYSYSLQNKTNVSL